MNKQKYNNSILGTAPWLNGKKAIQVPKKFLASALQSLDYKGIAPPILDAYACWEDIQTCFSSLKLKLIVPDIEQTAPSLQAPLQAVINRIETNTMSGSIESDAVLFAILNMFNYRFHDAKLRHAIVNWLWAYKGIEYALDVLILSQNIRISYALPFYNTQNNYYWLETLPFKVHELGHLSYFSDCELYFRNILVHLDEKVRANSINKLLTSINKLDITRKPLIAILLPQYPEIAQSLIADLKGTIPEEFGWLKLVLKENNDLEKIKELKLLRLGFNYFMGPVPSVIATLLVERKLDALDILIEENDSDYLLDILAKIGSPKSITKILATYTENSKNFERLLKVVVKWPLVAIISFAEHLINTPLPTRFIKTCFNVLVAKNHSAIPLFYEWVDEAQAALLKNTLRGLRFNQENVSDLNLPFLLDSPPWLNDADNHAKTYDLKLQTLPIKSLISFTTNEITAAKQLSPYYQKKLGVSPYSVENLLSCFGLYARDEKTSALLSAAITCVASNNINEFINICTSFSEHTHLGIHLSVSQYLPEGFGLAIWNTNRTKNIDFFDINYILTTYGDKAIAGLINLPEIKFQSTHLYWFKLVSSALAPRVANSFVNNNKIKEIAKQWLIENPKHAIYGLLPVAFDMHHKHQKSAIRTLCFLATQGFKSIILAIAEKYKNPKLMNAIHSMLETDQLLNYPASFPPEPFYWDLDHWRLPKLKNTKLTLPKSAITHLGTMLRFPVINGIYKGLETVKALCDEQSLADFAWDIFQSWLDFGAPSKDNWILTALGILGNNQTLSNLLPLLYEWPEQFLIQRTIAALDIFYLIGTDEALVHLNHYANTIKSHKLKQSAKRIIQQVAQRKKLTIDELEDRLIAYLDLYVTGSLKVNIGEQPFYLTINQNLELMIKNDAEEIIKKLPTPKDEKDIPSFNQTNITLKKLKKDVKQFISVQLKRLELMMCNQRMIEHKVFELYYLKHPLMNKLVKNLVWGIFNTEEKDPSKSKLIQPFRICEDDSFADENENIIALSDDKFTKIGLVHPIDLSNTQLRKFKIIFADYQIIQPFEQLLRHTFYLNDTDLLKSGLMRWESVELNAKKLIKLTEGTWESIPKRTSGILTYIEKRINQDYYASLVFEPGLLSNNKPDEQKLVSLNLHSSENNANINLSKVCFLDINNISISELIRDIEILINS